MALQAMLAMSGKVAGPLLARVSAPPPGKTNGERAEAVGGWAETGVAWLEPAQQPVCSKEPALQTRAG